MKPTYESHQQRAVEPDGTSHATRHTGDRDHFTLACAASPMPAVDRLVQDGDLLPVTCPGCRTALTVVITCPQCKTPGAEEFGLPIPHTDDVADCTRCVHPRCGHRWNLDPGAAPGCTECGGSGHPGRSTVRDPRCACGEAGQR
ncbi:hypothetical protein FHS34_008107 [Streptomyces echinatus]|uniref:Uncharacterized protein n=1 Tax=Streptomyces echinatus TaxID=67293 RepID=A0A7W9UVL4_9ACTN|nr:hypothetical protein [Streptomyces echinatus]